MRLEEDFHAIERVGEDFEVGPHDGVHEEGIGAAVVSWLGAALLGLVGEFSDGS